MLNVIVYETTTIEQDVCEDGGDVAVLRTCSSESIGRNPGPRDSGELRNWAAVRL
jgi:hypothetical protein